VLGCQKFFRTLGFSVDIRPQKGQLVYLEVQKKQKIGQSLWGQMAKRYYSFFNGAIVVALPTKTMKGKLT